jgi:hypothetical protein
MNAQTTRKKECLRMLVLASALEKQKRVSTGLQPFTGRDGLRRKRKKWGGAAGHYSSVVYF